VRPARIGRPSAAASGVTVSRPCARRRVHTPQRRRPAPEMDSGQGGGALAPLLGEVWVADIVRLLGVPDDENGTGMRCHGLPRSEMCGWIGGIRLVATLRT